MSSSGFGARAAVALVASFAIILPACADEEKTPEPVAEENHVVEIDIPVEVQMDAGVESYDSALEFVSLSAKISPSVTVKATEWLTFEFGLVLEPVVDPVDDSAFKSEGLFLEVGQAVANFGPLTINAGKFAPKFSFAFDKTPGVYNDNFNADLELTERLGLGAAYNLMGDGTDKGVIVSASAFRRDTTVLSESLFNNRGRLHLGDAGDGNHDGLESFAIAVDVKDLEAFPGLMLHVGYLDQAAGEGDPSNETAYVLSANYEFSGADETAYQLIAEWAHSDDALGFAEAESIDGARQDVITFGAGATWPTGWTVAAVVGLRSSKDPSADAVDESYVQISGGYFIAKDILLEAAWLFSDDGAGDSNTLGLKATMANLFGF